MAKRPFRHRVERTRNKHSRAVLKGDTIIIRLARGLSQTEAQDHISDLLRRMTKQLIEERKHTVTINPFGKILHGASQQTVTLASGKKYVFKLQAGKKLTARRTRTGFTVTVSPHTRRESLHKLLWKAIAKAEQRRIARLVYWTNAETLNVRINRVQLQFASSQWGSCSPRGVIMLNAALLFVPPSILRYIIIHELSHRRRGDHSSVYWKIVEEHMPTYEKAVERLSTYRLPML